MPDYITFQLRVKGKNEWLKKFVQEARIDSNEIFSIRKLVGFDYVGSREDSIWSVISNKPIYDNCNYHMVFEGFDENYEQLQLNWKYSEIFSNATKDYDYSTKEYVKNMRENPEQVGEIYYCFCTIYEPWLHIWKEILQKYPHLQFHIRFRYECDSNVYGFDSVKTLHETHLLLFQNGEIDIK